SSVETMLAMAKAGLNVFRVNFSHGDHETHRQTIRNVKHINKQYGYNLAVLADLQGPKLRIGDVEPNAHLNDGDVLEFTKEEILGNAQRVHMNYGQFASDVKEGERILLDDGKLILSIEETNGKDTVKAKVIQGGALKSKKGVNLPNTKISLPCLTEKDMADLIVALEENVEWIGLSFVRNSTDIHELKSIIKHHGSTAKVVSKIEKPEAVLDIDEIIKATDAAMVARGDLGVEVPMQSVPLIQKMIVEKCHLYAKPVIIATQMMETMIDSLTPTRAEVNDVANSVLDGADAVMLSGETSVGKYPVQVIETMSKIIAHIEDTAEIRPKHEHMPENVDERYITDSICYNASKIADQVGAMAILTMTHSGYTAFQIASHRPATNIVVMTENRNILNMVSLIWGVQAFYYDKMESTDGTFKDIQQIIENEGIVQKGDYIVKIASMPILEKGTTNMLKIAQVE
ncbi:MAG: pyruvate kinase, partial [Schleiferiaceae bacterium]|nr:pyruvate kinase [Schleiferiaceae bacterium]